MKREVRLLLVKACDALVLSVEHFNRSTDRGRSQAVLILLDHSFEMLLKAAIVHRGGRIREKHTTTTIGFDTCLRKGLSDATVKFLDENEVLSLQRVDELGYFSLSSSQLATHLGLTGPKTVALIRYAKVEADVECFKLVVIGKSSFKRYSQKALEKLRDAKSSADMDAVWRDHAPKAKGH